MYENVSKCIETKFNDPVRKINIQLLTNTVPLAV